MQHRSTEPRPRLCFLSYRHLSDLARGLIGEFSSRADIEVVDASFDAALRLAQAREQAGAVDVFVSAGSNAALLRRSVALPVATIKVDGYDLLLALLRARAMARRVGVTTHGDTIAPLDAVKVLLNIEIVQRAYRSAVQAREAFDALLAEGCEVIVGSSIVVELAEQRGVPGLLSYSPDSVRQGLEDALEMARVARLESTRYEQVHGVLQALQDAVLAVDAEHRVTAVNPPMLALLGLARPTVLGRALETLEPALSLQDTLARGEEQRGRILQFAGRDWVVHRTPIRARGSVVGAVLALLDANTIESADSRLRAQRKNRRPRAARYRFDDLLGRSPAFRRAVDAARRFAGTELTVLIRGESGTGKELLAQAIHHASPRAGRPFVALNCSALPEALLEGELFGHEEGAFTGALRGGRRGLLEAAHTGTLFLDEIGDMPLPLQTRLLRVLQEREVTRLGSTVPVPVDVRIVAATHQPLQQMVAERRFRGDLYYRLAILPITLPPLRERGDDILLLADALLRRCLQARGGSTVDAAAALAPLASRLRAYAWPGNVRELENICERLALHFAGAPVMPTGPRGTVDPTLALDCPELFPADAVAPPPAAAADVLATLQACGGRRGEAARRLGISRATLWRRMRAAAAASEG